MTFINNMHIKKFIHLTAVSGITVLLTACGKPAEETGAAPVAASPGEVETPVVATAPEAVDQPAMETADQLASYGIGYGIGGNFLGQDVLKVDIDALVAGIRDGIAAKEPRLPEERLQGAFAELEQRAQAQAAAAAQANLAAATAFLEKNAARPEVKVTPSGLQYEVLASGDPEAAKPAADDTVEVHYHGTLIDGTVFDSSIERGEPITIPVSGVIPGWVEALQMMSVGDKWKITLPPVLGYGTDAAGSIPPNSVLVFEVQLIGIQPSGAELAPPVADPQPE